MASLTKSLRWLMSPRKAAGALAAIALLPTALHAQSAARLIVTGVPTAASPPVTILRGSPRPALQTVPVCPDGSSPVPGYGCPLPVPYAAYETAPYAYWAYPVFPYAVGRVHRSRVPRFVRVTPGLRQHGFR